jgi:hypothetical protein
MARFVLELEHFIALIEGHLLELHDPTSNLAIELMVDPHIGQVSLRAILESELLRLSPSPSIQNGPPDPPEAREFLPNHYTRRPE